MKSVTTFSAQALTHKSAQRWMKNFQTLCMPFGVTVFRILAGVSDSQNSTMKVFSLGQRK
jgi:hypothetical protein